MEPKTKLNEKEIHSIIKKCKVCYIGMVDGDTPYVLPFNYGFCNGVIYFHSGPDGKKFDVLTRNNKVCIAFSCDHELKIVNQEVACSYSMKYRSVLLHGKIEMVEDFREKEKALNIIMENYTGRNDFSYNSPAVNNVRVFRVKPSVTEARTFGY